MAESVETPVHHADHHHEEPGFLGKYIFPTDHKMIAMQYLFTGMLMGILGGLMAYVFRMQLAFPGIEVPGYGLVGPSDYNALITNHGTIMIFWVAMPVLVAAFGNFLIPLMCGCDDMVFPKINRLSYQIFLVSALVLIASFFVEGGGFGGAWTAYPPLSAKAEYSLTPIGLQPVAGGRGAGIRGLPAGRHQLRDHGDELSGAGHEVHRHPDRGLDDRDRQHPVHGLGGPADRRRRDALHGPADRHRLLRPDRGGDPLLWQHLFWFFGHPEVYVVLLPALGITADIMCVFSRKKLFAYRTVLYTAIGTGVLSFTVWAHHQFIAGIDPRMAHIFTVTTLLISIPIAEMCFVYIATLYRGSITLTTPMLWALSFVASS